MLELTAVQRFVVWILPVLFAITAHEVAHGWVAYKCGDPTAKVLGRLTLNPLKHIDLVGTLFIPVVLFILSHGQFIFGWAKPVPVNFSNLKKTRRDTILVALAGCAANLLMAFIWASIAKVGLRFDHGGYSSQTIWLPIVLMGQAGIIINIVLMTLNLIPIPPLDGSRVVSALLPKKLAHQYNSFGRYGLIILLFMFATGIFWHIVSPFVFIFVKTIALIFHFPSGFLF